jgi:hypothetical protein
MILRNILLFLCIFGIVFAAVILAGIVLSWEEKLGM